MTCQVKSPRVFEINLVVKQRLSMATNEFAESLLKEANEIEGKMVATSTRVTYESSLRVYEKTMRDVIHEDAYPIDIRKMKIFIVLMKKRKRTYSTLVNYIRGFSFHFRKNGLEVLTQSIEFKVFHSGLRREMCGDRAFPKAKEPFELEFFERIVNILPMDDIANRRMMLCMTLSFSAFLRISELLALRKEDIKVEDGMGRIEIFIRRSKTDQYGVGESTFLFKSDSPSCPWPYLDVLETLEEGETIVGGHTEWSLRRSLSSILQCIGVDHVERYSFHSFRRGGAHLASKNGVADCMIKAHGRWRSEAYQRYTAVDKRDAGEQVAAGLARVGRAPQ